MKKVILNTPWGSFRPVSVNPILQRRLITYASYNVARGGTKLLRVLIFAIFAVFPAIRKTNEFPRIKITANIFPAKIYSRVNFLFSKIQY